MTDPLVEIGAALWVILVFTAWLGGGRKWAFRMMVSILMLCAVGVTAFAIYYYRSETLAEARNKRMQACVDQMKLNREETDQMIRECAAKVRKAYPGSYDDLNDGTLTKKVVTKYPDYCKFEVPDFVLGKTRTIEQGQVTLDFSRAQPITPSPPPPGHVPSKTEPKKYPWEEYVGPYGDDEVGQVAEAVCTQREWSAGKK